MCRVGAVSSRWVTADSAGRQPGLPRGESHLQPHWQRHSEIHWLRCSLRRCPGCVCAASVSIESEVCWFRVCCMHCCLAVLQLARTILLSQEHLPCGQGINLVYHTRPDPLSESPWGKRKYDACPKYPRLVCKISTASSLPLLPVYSISLK